MDVFKYVVFSVSRFARCLLYHKEFKFKTFEEKVQLVTMRPCLSAVGSPLENYPVSVRCHFVPSEKGTCLEMRSKHLPGFQG